MAGLEREVADLLEALDREAVVAAWADVDRLRARIAYVCGRVERLMRVVDAGIGADAVGAGPFGRVRRLGAAGRSRAACSAASVSRRRP